MSSFFISPPPVCWQTDQTLVFLSDASGHPNIHLRDLISGVEKQLTHNVEGHLKSYVYFDGTPYRGLGKASISVHSASGTIFYIQGREIRKVSADGIESTLATYPDGQMTAFTHVSHDGQRLCVPTTDARALDGENQLAGRPEYDIDARVQSERLSSYLRIYDTQSGELLSSEPVPRAWVTHVQFAPHNSNLILYNHEWCSVDKGIRRMWLFDGTSHTRLRTENGQRKSSDWICHEMWERDGSAIIYHGGVQNGPSFIGRINPEGGEPVEISLSTGCNRYGHFTVGSTALLVSDGYYEEEGDKATPCGDWISLLKVNWEEASIDWQPLCRSSSSWDSQDAHPHPILDHANTYCYFTSDWEGKRAVYRIAMADLIS